MSNEIIVKEFDKLVNYIKFQIDQEKSNKQVNIKEITANEFRSRQIKNIISIIKKYPHKLTLDNITDFKQIRGIGKGTIERIKEIITTGKLSELDNFIDISDEDKNALKELESIVGVGHSLALDFLKHGIKSIKQLKKEIKNGDIKVNEKVLLGLKYHGVFKDKIPRKEIDKIKIIIQDIITDMNKGLKNNEKYIFEICGSYRRQKDISGDIDILISKLDNNKTDSNLEMFINMLKKHIKKNNNNPLLVDDITDKNYETKYMGFAKYKDNPVRRIDIRYIPYESYFSALLYFTGSVELNKRMRQIAKNMGYKLSEYGLTKKSNNEKIKIDSEEDFFKFLQMEYLTPNLR